jgi:N-methylhydantoinase B
VNGEELTEGVLTLQPGDSTNLQTPGGGGFGDPADREVEAIVEDVRQGYVSEAEAARAYGLTGFPEPARVLVSTTHVATLTATDDGVDST